MCCICCKKPRTECDEGSCLRLKYSVGKRKYSRKPFQWGQWSECEGQSCSVTENHCVNVLPLLRQAEHCGASNVQPMVSQFPEIIDISLSHQLQNLLSCVSRKLQKLNIMLLLGLGISTNHCEFGLLLLDLKINTIIEAVLPSSLREYRFLLAYTATSSTNGLQLLLHLIPM